MVKNEKTIGNKRIDKKVHKTTENKLNKKINWKEYILSSIYGPLIIIQIILVFFLYNYYKLDIVAYVGWSLIVLFLIIGYLPKNEFKKKGEIEEGKSFIHTSKIVTSGIYSVIRHPMWLCWIILSLSLILMSQHCIMVIIGIPAMISVYAETYLLDKGNIDKFGNDYYIYMRKVPRLNFILGLIKRDISKRK